jgi:hypothetical protein
MKNSHKVIITFAIAAMSTLSCGASGFRVPALLGETDAPAASTAKIYTIQPAGFENSLQKPSERTRMPGRDFPGRKKYTIAPLVSALSQPARWLELSAENQEQEIASSLHAPQQGQ